MLRDLNKMRLAEDEPDSPAYVRDRTPLRKGQMTTLDLRGEFRRDPALPMLVGDDVFIKGIRKGVETGAYVYQRGKLLYGPGDPAASIEIDAQAFVLTMPFARNNGIWPRPPEVRDEEEPPGGGDTGDDSRDQERRVPPATGAEFEAEGVLTEALTKLWEQARSSGVEAIGRLYIRLFVARDAFRLLGAVRAVSGATKTVTFTGGYETPEGGSFGLEFEGPISDAQPVREFLEPQFLAASKGTLEAGIGLQFESGLPVTDEELQRLNQRLARFVSEAVHVTAEAKH